VDSQNSADAAPVATELRNAARPGRLRWLQGHRNGVGSWDAYEAAPGTPLTALLRTPQPWKNVRHWLLDLATEFAAATSDGSMPATLSLDRVWITASGGAKLLDFRAPGADATVESLPGTGSSRLSQSARDFRARRSRCHGGRGAHHRRSRTRGNPRTQPSERAACDGRFCCDCRAARLARAANPRHLTPSPPWVDSRVRDSVCDDGGLRDVRYDGRRLLAEERPGRDASQDCADQSRADAAQRITAGRRSRP
jgi:hypothetical protein